MPPSSNSPPFPSPLDHKNDANIDTPSLTTAESSSHPPQTIPFTTKASRLRPDATPWNPSTLPPFSLYYYPEPPPPLSESASNSIPLSQNPSNPAPPTTTNDPADPVRPTSIYLSAGEERTSGERCERGEKFPFPPSPNPGLWRDPPRRNWADDDETSSSDSTATRRSWTESGVVGETKEWREGMGPWGSAEGVVEWVKRK